MASLFQAPDVSIAIGTNVCVVVMDMYLVVLKVAAWFAAASASTVVSLRWYSANVSGTVTSQASLFSSWPRYECDTVWSFSVDLRQSHWFFGYRYLCTFNGSPYYIVELGVSLLSCAASSTWQSVKSSGIHVFAAWTNVWLTRSESKPVSHVNTDHLIAQPQASWCYWRSHKPITRMQGWCFKKCVPCSCRWSVGYIHLQAGDPRLDDPTPSVYLWFDWWYRGTWQCGPTGHGIVCIAIWNVEECWWKDRVLQ